ncbi:MAG: DUF5107 domain-containing protein [Phycisphaerae bacterium]|nr:DUF5107 domain-containing protein [Phycisphaerae bacterium]
MTNTIALAAGIMLAIGPLLFGAGGVSIEETRLDIPTYVLGPEDKSPPLWNQNVYPYPSQTDITRDKRMVSHRVVILENDFTRVLILPDLGGRLYAAHDKTHGDFDFIYHNHVIKPGLVALRGAWLSGGIEWNFPTLGHTVNTVSPVQYKIMRGKDGSVTCVVGATEWVRRMRWTVATTVCPERSWFRTRITLFNPTLTHNNGYFWANAASHAWADTQVIFPPTDYTYASRRANPEPWPLHGGIDKSWYKNIPYPADYFCGVPGDFNGVYNMDRDCGMAHCASSLESPGKKFWTWGTARSGAIWEDMLTDNDGQYIEVQSGRCPTQGDTWIFEPHMQESWDEYWYALKKMKGLVKANSDAAVNFRVEGGDVIAAVNVTRPFPNSCVKVFRGETEIHSERVDISPSTPLVRQIPLHGTGTVYRLLVLDAGDREIIFYSTQKPPISRPELQPVMPDRGELTAEQAQLAGHYALKQWDIEKAVMCFQEALRKDPGLATASESLGLVYYKTSRLKEALDLFQRALERNEDQHAARYYRALCKIGLGVGERTEEDLHMVGRRAAHRHVAPLVLASMAVGRNDLVAAERYLRQAVRHNPDDPKARVLLAAALRRRVSADEAAAIVRGVLEDDPLNALAAVESHLQGGADELGLLRDDPQYYIETACDYGEMNLIDDAIAALKLYEERRNAARHPFVYYHLGYYCQKRGEDAAARDYFSKGSQLSPDYVFPFRTESETVLRMGLSWFPDDWKLHYYLGTLLSARMRWQEGLVHLQQSRAGAPKYATLYRNLGEIYWTKLKEHDKAAAEYERAIACDPEDPNLYVSLDRLYELSGRKDRRAELFTQLPADVGRNCNLLLRRAAFLIDDHRQAEALEILRNATFHPWEGWTGAREVYLRAHRTRADALMREGRHEQAIQDLLAAMEYPENLGTGKPDNPVYVVEHYKLGCCYKALARKQQADEYFHKAAAESRASGADEIRSRAGAIKELGRTQEAETLLDKAGLKSE